MGDLAIVGTSRPMMDEDLKLNVHAHALQQRHRVPVLQDANDPHSYVFVPLFDGTGHDADDANQSHTNIGVLKSQVKSFAIDPDSRVEGHYTKGIGTQKNSIARHIDGAIPFTWDEKIEKAYRALCIQAKIWLERDPQARISIVGVGYSRGAVLAAGLARLIDRYGIADPDGLEFTRDAQGNLAVRSQRPPLVPPGEVAQAVGLFDPVATNMPANYDARLPPSVISGYSIMARDEQRKAFPHQSIIDAELTSDARFLRVTLPGGHSNVGGGNRHPGAEVLAFNSMVDYLNGLSGAARFAYRPLPDDLSLYAITQTYGLTTLPGMDRDGTRNEREKLANCKIVDPCRDAEPMNQALADRFEYRLLQPDAMIPATLMQQAADDLQATGVPLKKTGSSDAAAEPQRPDSGSPADPAHPDHTMLLQIRDGVKLLDRQVGKDYDDASERLSRSLLAASRDPDRFGRGRNVTRNGDALDRVDHVLLGSDGTHVFAVQGRLTDPAHRHVALELTRAIHTPVEQSDARLEAASLRLAQEQLVTQQSSLRPMQANPAPARDGCALA